MDREKIKILIKEQRAYFFTGATREEAYRIQALRKLRAWILKNQAEIEDALKKDLGKSRTESDMCEIGMVLEEIRFMLAHIHKWMAAKTVPSPLALFPARSFIKPSPRGVVLIMSPWNYPFLLNQPDGKGVLFPQAGGGDPGRAEGKSGPFAGAF